MNTDGPDDIDCGQHVIHIFAGLEVWLRSEVDPGGQDRDEALSELLADVALHLDRLGGQEIDSSTATFAAQERILNVLDWLGIATNDVHGLLHLVMGCTLQARDPESVHIAARHTWECLRSGTASGSGEPISPSLFIGDPR